MNNGKQKFLSIDDFRTVRSETTNLAACCTQTLQDIDDVLEASADLKGSFFLQIFAGMFSTVMAGAGGGAVNQTAAKGGQIGLEAHRDQLEKSHKVPELHDTMGSINSMTRNKISAIIQIHMNQCTNKNRSRAFWKKLHYAFT